MKEQPNYYAVIPADVRYDKDITPNAKLLYGEITALANKEGKCWATNNYFAELYNVSTVSISKWINQLVRLGYLTTSIKYKKDTKQIEARYIRIVNTPLRKVKDPIKEKFKGGIKEKFKENNTSNNNTSIISTNVEAKAENKTYGKKEINDLFSYWQETTGLPITSKVQANRNACNNLLRKYGYKDLTKLVDGVGQAQDTLYAPKIADFVSLQSKLNALLLWGKTKKNNNFVKIEA